jgi:hypothetical protein
VALTTDCHEYFIKVPSIAQSASPLRQVSGVIRPKAVAPLSNRFIGNLDSPFRQKIFDITVTEREAVVQPNGVTDDFPRESMSMVQRFRVIHGMSLPDMDLT